MSEAFHVRVFDATRRRVTPLVAKAMVTMESAESMTGADSRGTWEKKANEGGCTDGQNEKKGRKK